MARQSLVLLAVTGCCVLLLGLPIGAATNPGMVVRTNQRFFDYVSKIAISLMTANISSTTVPDNCNTVIVPILGTGTYCSTGNQLSGFKYASTSITINPGVGMTWSISEANVMLSSKWNYSLANSLGTMAENGGYTVTVTGISMSIQIAVGATPTGAMTVSASGCTCTIGSLTAQIDGAPAWLNTLLDAFVNSVLKVALEGILQNVACLAINVGGGAMVARQVTQGQVGPRMTMNIGIVSGPTIGVGYVDLGYSGAFTYAGKPVVVPFQPQIITPPASPTGTGMITGCITAYQLNSFVYMLYSNGLLNFNLSKSSLTGKTIPAKYAGFASYLQTTCCTTCKCIGRAVPALAKKKPQSTVTMLMKMTSAPYANLTSTKSICNTSHAQITFQIRSSKGVMSTAFVLNVAAQVTISLTIANNKIILKFSSWVFTKTSIATSSIGTVSVNSLSHVLAAFSDLIILPALNAYGKLGMPLPALSGFNCINPTAQLISGGVCATMSLQNSQFPG